MSRRDGDVGSFDPAIADIDGSIGPRGVRGGGRGRRADGRAERTDRDIVEVRNGGEVDNTSRYPGDT